MAVFTNLLRNIDYNNPAQAIATLANHIRQLQEELEYQLMNLDSSNINELNLGQTTLVSAQGKTITGDDDVHIDCGDWDEGD